MKFRLKGDVLFADMAGTDLNSDYREIRTIILLNIISLMALVVVVYITFFYIVTNNVNF